MKAVLLIGGIVLSVALGWFAVSNYQNSRPIAEENLRGLALSLSSAIENIALHDPSLKSLATFQAHDIAFFAIVDQKGSYRFHTNQDLINTVVQNTGVSPALLNGATSDKRITLRTGENAFEFNTPIYLPTETLALRLTLHTYRADAVIRRAQLTMVVFFGLLVAGWIFAFFLYRFIQGQTIDTDTNLAVTNSYMLSMPALAVSGAVNSNFISPMSTLIREKMAANTGMTLTDAMTQLRNQMNLPAGMDVMGDYMSGSLSGTNAAQYQAMHAIARQMAALMADQASLVMNSTGANMNRYKSMMATINSNMPGIAANVIDGQNMGSTFMTGMMSQLQTQLGAMPISGGFTNYSAMFRNMTSHGSFWSNTGTPMTPMNGGMM